MAFGVNEFPHTSFYDGQLSEVLAFYKQLVDDYNEIVDKLHKAEADWLDSRNYVEKWNRKWAQDFVDIRNDWVRVTKQITEVQKELIKKFTEERAAMEKYFDESEKRIKDNNASTVENMRKLLDEKREEFEQITDKYQESLKDALDNFNREFDASLEIYEMKVSEDLENFKVFVMNEMVTIMSLISSTDASINDFYRASLEKYGELVDKYNKMLEHELYKLEQRLRVTYVDMDAYDEIKKELKSLEERIEEVNKARIDIQADKVLVMSPVTHRMKRIQWVLDEMWIWYRQWGIDADEFDGLELTAEEFDNFVCDLAKLPGFIGIMAIDFDAAARWILLEKPDIIERLTNRIDSITYDKIAENKDKVAQEIADEAIATTASHFAGIIATVSVAKGIVKSLENADIVINSDGSYAVGKGFNI